VPGGPSFGDIPVTCGDGLLLVIISALVVLTSYVLPAVGYTHNMYTIKSHKQEIYNDYTNIATYVLIIRTMWKSNVLTQTD